MSTGKAIKSSASRVETKWHGDTKPRSQYYGGSAENYGKTQERYKQGEDSGNAMIGQGTAIGAIGAGVSDARNRGVMNDMGAQAAFADGQTTQNLADYQADRSRFNEGRAGIIGNASALENSANTMSSNYMKTDQAALAQAQGRNIKAAMSAGAAGGPGGMRNALAAAGAANATATSQGAVTRAQEYNQLIGMENAARAQAAGIRGNVAGMDQNAAQQAGGLAQHFNTTQANAYNSMGNVVNNQAQIDQGLANAVIGAGNTTQANYLNASTTAETAQLNAAQAAEAARQKNNKGGILGKLADPGSLLG